MKLSSAVHSGRLLVHAGEEVVDQGFMDLDSLSAEPTNIGEGFTFSSIPVLHVLAVPSPVDI